ncbi:MAG: LPS export ABC transporter ATP-binding protein [Pantoea sp. Brub]|nr:LPS export ABC transporter ATP-binding protein [Pantoea sp. Brub]
MTKLIAQNLIKVYNTRRVVDNVNLIITSGEIAGLLGPNGAGKTTMFYMLIGIVSPDKGSILIDNEDISILPIYARARKGIGYLPQEASIFRRLSVYDNIMAVLQIRNDLTKSQCRNHVDKLMNEFKIDHLHNIIGQNLSGGERRRVEIARTLAANPKFILMDEPFAGIDPISVIDIKKIIKYLSNKGLGILITDHNVRDTLSVCENTYILNHGKIIAQGNPNDVIRNDQVKKVYLGEKFII